MGPSDSSYATDHDPYITECHMDVVVVTLVCESHKVLEELIYNLPVQTQWKSEAHENDGLDGFGQLLNNNFKGDFSPEEMRKPKLQSSGFVPCPSYKFKCCTYANANHSIEHWGVRNVYAAVPIGHSTQLREDYNDIKTVLDLLKYEEHNWIICVDLKMSIYFITLLHFHKDDAQEDILLHYVTLNVEISEHIEHLEEQLKTRADLISKLRKDIKYVSANTRQNKRDASVSPASGSDVPEQLDTAVEEGLKEEELRWTIYRRPRHLLIRRRMTQNQVNKWLGCEQNICVGTSLIPVIRREGTIVPVTVLGVPVSKTQQVFYQLQYTDFAFDGVNTEQLDISSCLHFVSKVMCLPGQDKVIYHSCFHNHSSCHARIETVQTLHDLVTPVSPNKICFQVMSVTETVSAFYSTCVHKESLPMGLYCIEGNVRSLSKKEGNFNITSIGKRNLMAFPIQFNLSQINDFPWDMWTSEIKKDKGLLDLLTKQLKEAEIIFRHEQGELTDIEHEFMAMSGKTWWKSFRKSVHTWSQSSFQSAVGNVLFNPIIIIFLLVLMCIIYQVFVMCRIQKIYKNLKIEMKKEDTILREMLNRKTMTF
ncbi:uncharacterized protein ACNLHF_001942 [Anomaloglossus baeobatrachus]